MVFSFPIDRTFGTCRAFAACLLDGELARDRGGYGYEWDR